MLEKGHVLWLRVRFNNSDAVAATKHPCLIVDVDNEHGVIEVAHMDSCAGKARFKLISNSNMIICCENETVISKTSYAQLDNTFKIEKSDILEAYRVTEDKLSSEKLDLVINAYKAYHVNYEIDEDKIVYMSKEEILLLNPIPNSASGSDPV